MGGGVCSFVGGGMSVALQLNDVTLGYERHPAVHHLTGSIARGELLAICGPNGAGKSTLLKALSGALEPLGGQLAWQDCTARDIAFLPQMVEIDRSFPITVFDMVAMGDWQRSGLFGSIGRRAKQATFDAIARVGLTGLEDRLIGTLSGGQMQRMLFARLVMQDAAILLLDEPFTALDANTTEDLLDLIAQWHQQGRTVIAVLHDFDLVRQHFPRTLLLARECVAWGDTQETLSALNLAQARHMVEAFDRDAMICARVA